ncbi:MAG: helix-turn-helix domain-containing protein [bacterium]|nr:helix-turn-helix domain-containing protein [bacterium]
MYEWVEYDAFFAERIASLRRQKNVSAREMSLAIGQNGSYINRIENRQALPSMQGFFYICEYFDISPGEFFNSGTAFPVLLNDAVAELQKLDAPHLELIIALARGMQIPNKSTMPQ